jgi:HTH-type transcriptional regulator, transcriptional repressor of NAD biosynthesis genes
MTLGVTVGKFYPFHLGHNLLIDEAKRQVDRLVVLVGWKPQHQLSGSLRAGWIRELHPDVEVIEVLDDLPAEPEPWAIRTLEVLAGRQPVIAFSSEAYGAPWASAMKATHISIDGPRERFAVSGTILRADLARHWAMLTPPAKAYFAKRVSIVGVESSGTTTLAESLAAHFQSVFVPEYGRYYCEGRRHAGDSLDWDSYEFVQIATRQGEWEDDLARRANRLVVCDTDPLATHVWHKRYLGSYCEQVKRIVAGRDYDHYFLTLPDFGFVQDGTRDGEHIRLEMHDWFLETLRDFNRPYTLIGGTHAERMATATAKTESLLTFPPLDEP